MSRHILLVGMMGAGKTTVGSALAARLGWSYLDSDAQVEANTGRTVPQIFADSGEAAFRAEERGALAEAVASEAPVVVGVAGGAVLDPGNRELMREAGKVVWLRADVATLAGRVGTGEGRPLLGDNPERALRSLSAVREPLYAEVADVIVDVDRMTPGEVVEEILARLGAVGGPDVREAARAHSNDRSPR